MPRNDSTLDRLYRIGGLVNRTEDPHEALELILDEIVETLGAASASIALLNPDTGGLRIEVQRGLPAPAESLELKPGQGVTGWVALHGKPAVVPDVSRDPRYHALRPAVRSELAVPMEHLGRTIGVVNCDSDRESAFSERDAAFLSLLTNEAVKVVTKLWLMRRLNTMNDRLESIIGATGDLVRARDEAAVLADLAARGLRLFGGAACAAYTLSNDKLTPVAAAGELRDATLNPALDPVDTALGVAVKRGRVVSVENAGRNEEHLFTRLPASLRETAVLAAPIAFGGETLGLLVLFSGTAHRYSDDERRLLVSLASLGASALRNARLYARIFAAEDNLRENERLTTLGLLSAEIAHEIRNPLTVIRLLFDSLNPDFPAGDPRAEDVRVIAEKLGHLESIVSRVLEVGRRRANDAEEFDLGAEAADTLLLMRMKLEMAGVVATLDRPAAPLRVAGNRGEIRQAMLNLLLNAVQAMPGGGAIRIALERDDGEGAPAAVIRIADTGPGIPASIRARVFESFLTGRAEGTGLGLSIVKRILRGHDGDIVVESSGPGGTVFRLTLPLAR